MLYLTVMILQLGVVNYPGGVLAGVVSSIIARQTVCLAVYAFQMCRLLSGMSLIMQRATWRHAGSTPRRHGRDGRCRPCPFPCHPRSGSSPFRGQHSDKLPCTSELIGFSPCRLPNPGAFVTAIRQIAFGNRRRIGPCAKNPSRLQYRRFVDPTDSRPAIRDELR
jgi:hypothetical protein